MCFRLHDRKLLFISEMKMFSGLSRGTEARHQFWITLFHRGHLKWTKDPSSSSYLNFSGWKEDLGHCGAEMSSQCRAGGKEAAGQASRGEKTFQMWATCFRSWHFFATTAHILGLWLCCLGSGECEHTMCLKRVISFGLWTLWVRPFIWFFLNNKFRNLLILFFCVWGFSCPKF